ncbi:hypothetical protein D9758_010248 [Tetrapyrgos nigripes]|uniref:Reverse transcriptase domain-containing protein n=1 Tax=Tetrapyrgos nigripes TaxID=182062 RepID=A0A8H5GAE3_9AGAR|nr:hypothetical protein D9758_010248 [Tetrapyrgos nigripes]
MKNGKATRPGTIPNDLFNAARDIIVPYLGPIHRAIYNLEIYPNDWSLRKLGKPDYRPIILSNGHGRLANSCAAGDIIKCAEILGLLPALQFGAWPGHNTMDSIHLLIDCIKALWRKGYVVTALFMDMKGAFPSVDLDMLCHELRMSPELMGNGGEDQGDPFLVVGYILYVAGLLRLIDKLANCEGFGFMDDVVVISWEKRVKDIHEQLGFMIMRHGGVMEWMKEHNCMFGIDKFKVVDLTRKKMGLRDEEGRPGIKVGDGVLV